MKRRALLTLSVLCLCLVCASSQGAKPRNTREARSSGRCPYPEGDVKWQEWGGVRFWYYWKCRYVMGSPEWDMYIKHGGSGVFEVHYERFTKIDGEEERLIRTYVFVSGSYEMLDGGNTSDDEPSIVIGSVKRVR